ncbi:MAG: D-alanine--D-alanine ligase family protein [Tissierellia bacterium]|nr:D-alanine--D-alanine ligase family protein [Tissierellia bacterium]
MKTIAVFFGGRSVEHEVSVITGMQIMENMDGSKYHIVPVYITKEGRWLSGDSLKNFKTFKNQDFSQAHEVYFDLNLRDRTLYRRVTEKGGLFKGERERAEAVAQVDLIFPALHGTFGEDGNIQGYFETLGLPYAGSSTVAAAVGMDKAMQKNIFKASGLPVLEGFEVYRSRWKREPEAVAGDVAELGYPVFVKPSNLGSSIGISKVKDASELTDAMELAAFYSEKLLVERAAKEPRELNCAVLGYEEELITSQIEEPIGWKDLLKFEDKYMGGKSGTAKGGKQTSEKRNIPAKITDQEAATIEKLAKGAFAALSCSGTARIDFLMDEDGIYINEINTLPGSLGFYLWEGKGLSFTQLVDRIIDIAFTSHRQREENQYTYDAQLFEKTSYGSKL